MIPRCLAAFFFGLVIGCFTNTLEYRLRSDVPLFTDDCYCTDCGHRLPLWQQIPVIGYLILHGKCGFCGSPVSIRYPLVEAGMALWYLICALVTGSSVLAPVLISFSGVVLFLTVSLFLRKTPPRIGKVFGGLAILLVFHFIIAFGLFVTSMTM